MRTVAAGLLAALLASPAAAQNATGEPVISGLWVVGEALAVATDGISDPQGVSSAAFAHQWVRVAADGAETDIAAATSSTHTLADSQQGGKVKVRVSFNDDAGNPEARTSAAYPPEGEVLPKACELEPWTTLGPALLSATMIHREALFFHGYWRDSPTPYGALSPTDFLYDGRTRTLVRLDASTSINPLLEAIGYEDWVNLEFEPASTSFNDTERFKFIVQTCDAVIGFWPSTLAGNRVQKINSGVGDWLNRRTSRVRVSHDEEAPTPVSATALGRVVTVAFSEPLYEHAPVATPSDKFTVRVNGSSAAIEGFDIVRNTLKLTLASPLGKGDEVEVDLTNNVSDNLLYGVLGDLVRNAVDTSDIVEYEVRVLAPPALQSSVLAADGATLTLTYDEDLDGASVPPAGAFTVRVGGAVRALAPVNPVAVAGRAVVLRLAKPAGAGEAVTVAYEKPPTPAGGGP